MPARLFYFYIQTLMCATHFLSREYADDGTFVLKKKTFYTPPMYAAYMRKAAYADGLLDGCARRCRRGLILYYADFFAAGRCTAPRSIPGQYRPALI